MAVLTRGKTTASFRAARHLQSKASSRSLANAVRHYWSSRHPGRASSGPYSYMKPYPARPLPTYDEHVGGLDYAYMRGMQYPGSQPRRNSSNWAPEDGHEHGSQGKDGERRRGGRPRHNEEEPIEGREPWETRTRMAGERHLRLMEEHMRLLRRDPYWALFGISEKRGVWNPWKSHYEMHERMVKEASSRPAHKIDIEVTSSEEKSASESGKKADVIEPEAEFRYDPILNRRVHQPRSAATNAKTSGAPTMIPVKAYVPESAPETKPTEQPQDVVDELEIHKTIPKAGFAKQPWLVEEGFVHPSYDAWHGAYRQVRAGKPSAWDVMRARNERQAASLRQHLPSKSVENKTPQVTQAIVPESSAKATSLRSEAVKQLEEKYNLKAFDRRDTNEDLHLLRPKDVRAVPETQLATQQPKLDRETLPPMSNHERWSKIESMVSNMMKEREERLNKEFAADKWRVTRGWSSYPGEIPRTPEERRERRELLERSFNSSLNKFEMDMMKILGSSGSASNDQDLSIHSTSSIRNVANYIQSLRDQINAKHARAAAEKQAQRQREADVLLRKEIEQQRAAMSAHESRPRIAKSYRQSAATESDRTIDRPSKVVESGATEAKGAVAAPSEAKNSLTKEEDLINEIRAIYEGAYGKIEGQIRQVKPAVSKAKPEADAMSATVKKDVSLSKEASNSVSSKAKPTTDTKPGLIQEAASTAYLLLAYDKVEKKVRVVRTKSTGHEDTYHRRSVEAILSALSDPARYFDYIERLEKAGYRLVAGSRSSLVFKDTLNRQTDTLIDLDGRDQESRGWGSPNKVDKADKASKPSKPASTASTRLQGPGQKAPSSINSRSPIIRRLEERFSGPGMRFTEPPPLEHEQLIEQSKRQNLRKTIMRVFFVVGIVYGFGVFMEWAKERDRERLTREYQLEVQRVRELERKRALEQQSVASRWGF